MTPLIALDLSLDGIVVLSRAPVGPDRGKWWREGIVRLDDEDMAGELTRMRARCAARVGEDFTSILVIPDSQLLFTSLERDDRSAKTTIRALLNGRTPYPVEDLAFDFVERGDRLQVAVVARDTLLEAEAFASGFGFRPLALVGNPADGPYPGIPDFGPTGIAAELLRGEPLSLDLGEGFSVIPAPDRPDVAAAETSDAATPPPAASLAIVASKTPSAEPADQPQVGPMAPSAVIADAPVDFASFMATTPDIPAPEADETATRTVIEADPSATHDEATPIAPPAFSTRRRAAGERAVRSEPGLTRITPRLSRPASGDGAPEAAAATSGPAARPAGEGAEPQDLPVHTTAPASAATAQRDDAPTPTNRSALLSALAKKTGRAANGFDRESKGTGGPLDPVGDPSAAAVGKAEASDAPSDRTQDKAAPPPRGASASRLGLYLTLSLLALLGVLALWSITGRGDDVSSLAASDDATGATDMAPDSAATETSVADLASPGDIAAPAPADQTADDLAALLPDSQGDSATALAPPAGTDDPQEAGIDSGSDGEAEFDDVVAEGAAGGLTAVDAGPEIAVVTTDAEPFELPRDMADAPETGGSEDIYIASIDPVIAGSDAIALPRAEPPVDTFSPQTSPAPAGTDFDTGNDGLVVASASGTLAPGGYSVIAGRPATLPAPRPEETPARQATQGAVEDAARTELGRVRPTPRPEDAPERAERLTFNGFTRDELTRTPPVRRPAAVDEAAARAEVSAARQAAAVQAAASAAVASLAQTDAPAGVPEPDIVDAASQSRYALAQSRRPRERPRAVEQDAARIVTQRRERAAPAAVASAGSTSLPAAADSSRQTLRSAGGSVSRAATQSNQIRLREMNLIGVYGRPDARRALVRLSNGRYVKVEVGDRLERGRVTAIGESEVIYQQNGRNYALRMPQT